eukprot:CAMPEP_0195104872 /NCGR_PEP_ID=MMETSP0448-20130528/74104_1 /TAXON_ID=66468 /ORGANISM="Heterocapsa triquestra, Strain CCMP 448" /LENGTH=79 /DNA_ID=CAMNT_0040140797 /DNA_START=24 /DNA_END=260 /DNA_ORIENTATION=-
MSKDPDHVGLEPQPEPPRCMHLPTRLTPSASLSKEEPDRFGAKSESASETGIRTRGGQGYSAVPSCMGTGWGGSQHRAA